jgi:hypothetical protein
VNERGLNPERKPEPRIVVVGPCASGKSTLVSILRPKGYNVHSCAQEHSHVQRLWTRYCRADVLIYLDVGLACTNLRKDRTDWPEARLVEQHRRLEDARSHCDFYLYTDDLSRQEVAVAVEGFLGQVGIVPQTVRDHED